MRPYRDADCWDALTDTVATGDDIYNPNFTHSPLRPAVDDLLRDIDVSRLEERRGWLGVTPSFDPQAAPDGPHDGSES